MIWRLNPSHARHALSVFRSPRRTDNRTGNSESDGPLGVNRQQCATLRGTLSPESTHCVGHRLCNNSVRHFICLRKRWQWSTPVAPRFWRDCTVAAAHAPARSGERQRGLSRIRALRRRRPERVGGKSWERRLSPSALTMVVRAEQLST